MDLGTFSVSLNVADIDVSLDFYQRLGFEVVAGERAQNWLILSNQTAVIGLFQDMFEENIMTFNPTDVRAIQKKLKESDIMLLKQADETTEGPDHVILKDPDGNTILLDQH